MNSIILHQINDDGFNELIPEIGKSFPQVLQIDASGAIIWSEELIDSKSELKLIMNTSRDMFAIIDEQQKRIDDLSSKLNTIINFLK